MLNLLALINGLARRPDRAHAYLREAETLSSANNYRDLLAVVTTNRSWVYLSADQHQEAYDYAISTLDLIRSHESAPSEYAHLVNLMRAAHALGHFDEAAHWAQTALPMTMTKLREGYILISYGNIQRDRGDLDSSLDTYHRAAVIHRQLGDRNREAETLDATGTAYTLRPVRASGPLSPRGDRPLPRRRQQMGYGSCPRSSRSRLDSSPRAHRCGTLLARSADIDQQVRRPRSDSIM